MSKDITYCGYSKCLNTDCERHATHSTKTYDSFAYFHDCDKYPPMEFSQDDIADMIDKTIQVPSCLTNPERYEELLERYRE